MTKYLQYLLFILFLIMEVLSTILSRAGLPTSD